VFDNLLSTRSFMKKVTDRIDADKTYECLRWAFNVKGERRVYPWVIDTSVYSRFRCFRLPLCRKRKANATPLTIMPNESTYKFTSIELIDRVLEATCQWRLHTAPSQIVRTIAQPAPQQVLSMAASGRKNPFTSVPIRISSENFIDNPYLRIAWDAIEGNRWWPHNKKTVLPDNAHGIISVIIYVDEHTPAFCPMKCYYNKYMAYRARTHMTPTLLRWQPEGAPTSEDCHDHSGHVKINISAYEFASVRYLAVTSYCYRGCYSFLRGLGWNCKLKDRIPFPHETQQKNTPQQSQSAPNHEPVRPKVEQQVHSAKNNPT
jgi:hypothetical protein